MFGLSIQELIVVGIVAVLLFGKRLPDVAKSLGQQYREFRKGLAEIQSTFNVDTYTRSSSYSSSLSSTTSPSADSYEYDDYDAPTAPKFEPPPSEPQVSVAEPTPPQDASPVVQPPSETADDFVH